MWKLVPNLKEIKLSDKYYDVSCRVFINTETGELKFYASVAVENIGASNIVDSLNSLSQVDSKEASL